MLSPGGNESNQRGHARLVVHLSVRLGDKISSCAVLFFLENDQLFWSAQKKQELQFSNFITFFPKIYILLLNFENFCNIILDGGRYCLLDNSIVIQLYEKDKNFFHLK